VVHESRHSGVMHQIKAYKDGLPTAAGRPTGQTRTAPPLWDQGKAAKTDRLAHLRAYFVRCQCVFSKEPPWTH